jgi:hypothetical protein
MSTRTFREYGYHFAEGGPMTSADDLPFDDGA